MQFEYVFTSSKCLLTVGCHTLQEAEKYHDSFSVFDSSNPNDCEEPCRIYTWQEWLNLAESCDFDPHVISA